MSKLHSRLRAHPVQGPSVSTGGVEPQRKRDFGSTESVGATTGSQFIRLSAAPLVSLCFLPKKKVDVSPWYSSLSCDSDLSKGV